ncbi:hypothetical protein DPX16_1350 [Anabarilius grahami]|uniref:Uncharacterized protein n=1 Tax=Anabarilius grahami TaxID=495550 RepID=A0A3N0Y7H8_ANAGA|nr:hypothetical protein DPX16_1350 [Anabarilius grahami]
MEADWNETRYGASASAKAPQLPVHTRGNRITVREARHCRERGLSGLSVRGVDVTERMIPKDPIHSQRKNPHLRAQEKEPLPPSRD